jgi:hypothetical protein
MGVGKDMKTFFAAMNEQVGMGGYGGKIKSTPMGPFRWNDTIQLWENVNNGMTMNNVAFQDMFMMDYESNSGDSGSAVSANFNPTLTPSDWGNLNTMTDPGNDYWASSTGAQLLIADAANVAFSNLSGPITVTFTSSGSGAGPQAIKYSLNGGAAQTYSTAITISNTDTLKVGVTAPGGTGTGTGNVIVTNTTTSTVLDQIPYIINLE